MDGCSTSAAPQNIGEIEGPRLRGALCGQAHVWLLTPDEDSTAELDGRLLELLDAEERQRHERLRRPADRQLFLAAHAATRLVLSRYLDRAPESLSFATDNNGRPALASDATLEFNLSHTPGCVACVVSETTACGVDVQAVEGVADPLVVAETYCSADERAWLHAQPAHEQRLRFFELWTLKEAFIKARGTVELSPERYSFDVTDEPKRIRVRFEPELDEAEARWQFELCRPTPEHVLGVALRRDPARGALRVVFNEATGLRSLLEPGGAR